MIDQICTSCAARSIGNCILCDAPVCQEHAADSVEGLRTCKDHKACAARMVENFAADERLSFAE